MEFKKINDFLKTYKHPATCMRISLFYLIFLFLATHTSVFDYGITKSNVNFVICALVMLYRFLSFVVVPAMLVIWWWGVILKKNPMRSH